MNEVKMWTIEGSQASPVPSISEMDSEQQLEEILVNNPELLMPGLTLVGRQMKIEGGKLDLLGVASDGRLVVFELKRGKPSRDAIAQIIDYASSLEDMDLATEEWYTENTEAEDLESLRPLRMFLVGLGTDDTTERMVNFLANRNVDILLLTFHVFTYEGKTLLVRQVDKKYGVSCLFYAVKKMFQENWRNPLTKSLNDLGLGFYLLNPDRTGKFESDARINAGKNQLRVVFSSSVIGLCIDKFKLPIQEIPFDTWPRGHEANAQKDLTHLLEKCPKLEIQFVLTETDWETHQEKLDELTHAVYEAHSTA